MINIILAIALIMSLNNSELSVVETYYFDSGNRKVEWLITNKYIIRISHDHDRKMPGNLRQEWKYVVFDIRKSETKLINRSCDYGKKYSKLFDKGKWEIAGTQNISKENIHLDNYLLQKNIYHAPSVIGNSISVTYENLWLRTISWTEKHLDPKYYKYLDFYHEMIDEEYYFIVKKEYKIDIKGYNLDNTSNSIVRTIDTIKVVKRAGLFKKLSKVKCLKSEE